MTGRERYMRVYRGEIPDRPPVKLWKLYPEERLIHPAYEPVYRLGMEKTDLVLPARILFDNHIGRSHNELVRHGERPSPSPEWIESVSTVSTPEGELESVYTTSTCGKPGYQKEFLLKEPGDIKKLLSIHHEPIPFDPEPYYEAEKLVGEKGITYISLGNAVFELQRIVGSENFAFWSVDFRGLLLEAISVFAKRTKDMINSAFNTGLKPVFGWAGPEVCIPPLMSPEDFDEFVVQFDKPLIDLIHERGGYIWVHCHGKVGPVFDRFVEMGVDVLNPIEPPPMGDITLSEAFDRSGGRMGLEGNIQEHDLMTADPDYLASLIREAVDIGMGRRFILCPSDGYMVWPEPDDRLIQNLLVFIEEGTRGSERSM